MSCMLVLLHKFGIAPQVGIDSHLGNLLSITSRHVDVLGTISYHLPRTVLHIYSWVPM